MNLKEAEELVNKIKELNCGGMPVAVYDGRTKGKPWGESYLTPKESDPGIISCKLRKGLSCIFSGGDSCPVNFKGDEIEIVS